jgi:FkbM family methyltransferase
VNQEELISEKNTKYGYISYYPNDIWFAEPIDSGGMFDEEFVFNCLAQYIANSKTILDIGSHVGSHIIMYKYINPSAKIYGFEPQSKIFKLLKNNIEKNNYKDVEIFNYGVANKSIKTTLNKNITDGFNCDDEIEYGSSKWFNLAGVQVGKGGEEIETLTVDSLNLDSCDFIKIDVEGFEPLVLLGAENTIKKYKPVISFEYNYKTILKESAEEFGIEFPMYDGSFEILRKYGYSDIRYIYKNNFIALS